MAKQQHQNPAQGTSSTNQRRNDGQSQAERVDDTMDIGHRAGHTSSTDSMYGTHSSLGGADERGDGADPAPAEASGAQAPGQEPPKRRATKPAPGGEHAQAEDAQDESARVRPGEAQGQSKYSPTAGEQDKLSRAQGGAPLKDSVLKDAPSSANAKKDASPQSNQSAAPSKARSPREGGHGAADDDSPTVRSPANPGGKLTATHDIDLAGPDNSATKRDK